MGSVIEGPLGRVWVADLQASELRVFERDGRFVRTVGRQGEGPGEFRRLGTVHLAPDGTVWVDDGGLRRWVVFDSAGVHLGVHSGNSNVGGGQRRWMPDGRLVEVGMAMDPSLEPGLALTSATPTYSVRRLDAEGHLSPPDTLPVPELPEREVMRFVDAGGVNRATRGIPLRRSPMGRLGFDEARDLALAELDPPEGTRLVDGGAHRIPEHFAPFYNYHPSTDGSLWVVNVRNAESQALDVFNAGGVYLGHFDLPPDLSRLLVKHITGERIYGVAMDELGVASVVVIRIERP